jgi:hypothetical protein
MERDYDLFERSQDNSLVWRGSVHGLEHARRKLQELAKNNQRVFRNIRANPPVVALVNIAEAGQLSSKRVVFQIAYDEHHLVTRTKLLRHNGYEVVSVVGNEAAKKYSKLAATLRPLYRWPCSTGTNQKRNG